MIAPYAGRLTGQLCQCADCGQTFGGERGFDLHRTGDYAQHGKHNTRRCLTEAEILAAGLSQDSRNIWRRPHPPQFTAASGESGPSVPSPVPGHLTGAHAPEVAA